ncbi:MAG TPA: Rap1a/Tai family immunity protein [Acetobacteraceae bacterium]|nr:Rap1a/Tai family immunity protein [Acetobacteraceae bacterium]
MRGATVLLAGIALLAAGGTAEAQRASPVDGNKLLGICTRGQSGAAPCDAYINGVADAAVALAGEGKLQLCIPQTVTGIQMRDVTVKWLRAHPEERQHQAGVLVLRALREAFPCKG